MPQDRGKVRIIPLGGLGEIGRNMMAIETPEDIVVIDAGLMFPREEMLGVDLVIPDVTYLRERLPKVRGIVLTHGHEDHIGALPYVLPHLPVPIYATELTAGLVRVKLKEHRLLASAQVEVVKPGDNLRLGQLEARLFHVCHSIPDAVGVALDTPAGLIVHSGDFKLDYTPVDGVPFDLAKLARLGDEGVLLLMSDSTYAERPGYTPSEQVVGEALDHIIGDAQGRVIVATFASLISRVQNVLDAATRHGRRVFVIGRSMTDNVKMALDLGYLSDSEGVLAHTNELRDTPPEQTVIIATGSQGEPTSALARMANRDHRQISVKPGDTVVISASPIPGNEVLVNRTVDNLFKLGADVLYDRIASVHVHGHGSREELKMVLALARPRFFVPIHGEYRHLVLHARLAQSLGVPSANCFVLESGDILELTSGSARVVGTTSASPVYVDGVRVGDVDSLVLRDRRALSHDGVVVVILEIDKQTGKVVGIPDVVSRGFVDETEAASLLEDARQVVTRAVDHGGAHLAEWGFVNTKVKEILASYLYEQTRRRPLILPVAMEV